MKDCKECKWDMLNGGGNLKCAGCYKCKDNSNFERVIREEEPTYVYIVKYTDVEWEVTRPFLVEKTRYFSSIKRAETFINNLSADVMKENPCLNFRQVQMDI